MAMHCTRQGRVELECAAVASDGAVVVLEELQDLVVYTYNNNDTDEMRRGGGRMM